jgi:hypothetical protein
MTYALLIYRTRPPSEPIAASEERAALAGHRAVQVEAAGKGQLHAVARLDEASRARTVTRRGGAHEVTDGPYIESKEWLVGFYLVDCDGEEEALARARRICPDSGHAIEVRPVTWRWKP